MGLTIHWRFRHDGTLTSASKVIVQLHGCVLVPKLLHGAAPDQMDWNHTNVSGAALFSWVPGEARAVHFVVQQLDEGHRDPRRIHIAVRCTV